MGSALVAGTPCYALMLFVCFQITNYISSIVFKRCLATPSFTAQLPYVLRASQLVPCALLFNNILVF